MIFMKTKKIIKTNFYLKKNIYWFPSTSYINSLSFIIIVVVIFQHRQLKNYISITTIIISIEMIRLINTIIIIVIVIVIAIISQQIIRQMQWFDKILLLIDLLSTFGCVSLKCRYVIIPRCVAEEWWLLNDFVYVVASVVLWELFGHWQPLGYVVFA